MPPPQPKLTPEQAAAIHTRDVSIGLSAGAGCGKTFVLTQRFLSQLEPGRHADPLSGIVALTFTERAAREMRDRIRTACQAKLASCPAEQVEHWLQIIRRIDSARISTIHSFCASLLRSHAVEAGLDPQFGLLDQAASDALLRHAIDESLRELLAADDESCAQLVLHYGVERVRDQLRALVRERFQIDSARFQNTTPEELAAAWLGQWRQRFLPELLQGWSASDEVRHLLRLLASHQSTNPEMRRRSSVLAAGLPAIPTVDEPAQQLESLRKACQVQGGGGKGAWDDEETYKAVRDALTVVRKSIDALRGTISLDEADVLAAAEIGLMAFHVMQHVGRRYDGQKQQNGLLDFDDLLLKTRDLLRDSSSVRNRAAAGIDFLMVDEFQDTDPVQWEIIRHLSGGGWQHGKLFLVGDVKQSIYGFRRADPRVFEDARNQLPERGRLPLSVNFRSQPEILKFVNHLFAESMGAGYEPLQPHVDKQLSPTPTIEFLFSAPENEDDKETATQRRKRESDWIARRITAFLTDGVPRIRDETANGQPQPLRQARPGDVAILFRTLSNVATYEDALRQYGLEYYLVGGRAFYAQQEVFDLINLCRYIDDADDEVALAGVLRSPFFSLSDDTLFAISEAGGGLGNAMLSVRPSDLPESQKQQVGQAIRVLGELRSLKDRVPLVELLQRAIAETGYDAALLLEFLGPRKLANLRKLVEMAREFDRLGLFTLKDFVARLRDSVAQQTDEELAATHPETSNVIRLMTVHQSKGLEFPIVFVADMDWTKRGGAQFAHLDRELGPLLSMPRKRGIKPTNPAQVMHNLIESRSEDEETKRLLYVAATRAADYLLFSAGLPAVGKVSSPWLTLIANRFNLETGLPRVDETGAAGLFSPEEFPAIKVAHSAPEVEPPQRQKGTPASNVVRFRELVENAEADELPETLAVIKPDRSLRKVFSVSEIEEADAQLHNRAAAPTRPSGRLRETDLDASQRTDLGTIVHEVLERVDPRRHESISELLEQELEGVRESVRERLKAEASACLEAWCRSGIPAELSKARKLFREVDFYVRWQGSSSGAADIAGQIDCLFETHDSRWCLLDYKTGRGTGDDAERVRQHYGIQLGLYALAARDLLGRLPDRVEVILLGGELQRVGFELTEQFVQDVTARVSAALDHIRAGSR